MEPETSTFTVPLTCRFLLHAGASHRLQILALHGYGSNPEAMLRLTVGAVGAEYPVASLQAPFPHYLQLDAGAEAGYNWGVRQHHAEAIQLHHSMVRATLEQLRERTGIPAERTILMGFSQPVGLNYRFAGTDPQAIGGVIALCGGVPRDWEDGPYQTVEAPILHISRDQDEYFPAETARTFPDRLRRHASRVEFHLLPGAHRFPSKSGPILREWLSRIQ